MAILQPWPPGDYLAPQPFDQRGCCWPWGPEGPSEKLAMRWFSGVYRADGNPMDVEWTWLALGFDWVCTVESAVRLDEGNWYTERTANLLNTIFFWHNSATGLWEVAVTMGNDVLPICIAQAVAVLQPDTDFYAGLELEITTINGPAPAPDRMLLSPFRWYTEVDPDLFHHY